jgi:hypothetical protein
MTREPARRMEQFSGGSNGGFICAPRSISREGILATSWEEVSGRCRSRTSDLLPVRLVRLEVFGSGYEACNRVANVLAAQLASVMTSHKLTGCSSLTDEVLSPPPTSTTSSSVGI